MRRKLHDHHYQCRNLGRMWRMPEVAARSGEGGGGGVITWSGQSQLKFLGYNSLAAYNRQTSRQKKETGRWLDRCVTDGLQKTLKYY